MSIRYPLAILFAAGALFVPLRAADCSLTSTSAPMLAGGLAETVGDLVLQCAFGAPNSTLTGTLFVNFDEKLANQIDSQKRVSGVTILVGDDGSATPLSGAVVSTEDGQNLVISAVSTNFDANGKLRLRIGGFRAPTAPSVLAKLFFIGSTYVNISPQSVNAGHSVDSFLATTPDSLLQPNSYGVTGLDLSSVIAGMDPNLTVRLTESDVAAFHAKLGSDTNGTRIAVIVPNLPRGSRVFAPDAVAGSTAATPTSSGFFGTAPNAGSYAASTPPWATFLLVRVKDPAADGTGGTLAWQPVAGPNSLAGVTIREAGYQADGSPILIYEVVEANPNIQESAQIPLYAFAGPTEQNGQISVRASLRLEPIPAIAQTPNPGVTIPSPRYLSFNTSGPDCAVQVDCNASWAPRLRLQANSPTTRILSAYSGSAQGFLGLSNEGGEVALWTGSVDYGSRPQGWLRLGLTSGATQDRIGLTYSLVPVGLRPGTYHATIVYTLKNAPDNSAPTVSQAIEMVVQGHPSIVRKRPGE